MPNKKVLILTHMYPPHSGVGAIRTAFLSKYLPQYGYTPTVITSGRLQGVPELDFELERMVSNLEIYRIDQPESDYSKKIHAKIRRYPDRFISSELFGYRNLVSKFRQVIESIFSQYTPDVIISSSPPEAMLKIGSDISRKYSIPYVADVRDIPEQWETSKRLDNVFMHYLLRHSHSKLLNKASAIVTVSKGFSQTIKERLSWKKDRKIDIIPNGMDPDFIHMVKSKQIEPDKLNIIYTGKTYYKDHEGLHIFFKTLNHAISEGVLKRNKLKVSFIGTEASIITPLLSHYKLKDIAEIFPTLSYSDSISFQKGAQIKLHLNYSNVQGITPSKIFEYIGVGGFILSVPYNKEAEAIFYKYTGNEAICSSSVTRLTEFLGRVKTIVNNEELTNEFKFLAQERLLNLKEITRQYQAKVYAGILDKVSSS